MVFVHSNFCNFREVELSLKLSYTKVINSSPPPAIPKQPLVRVWIRNHKVLMSQAFIARVIRGGKVTVCVCAHSYVWLLPILCVSPFDSPTHQKPCGGPSWAATLGGEALQDSLPSYHNGPGKAGGLPIWALWKRQTKSNCLNFSAPQEYVEPFL